MERKFQLTMEYAMLLNALFGKQVVSFTVMLIVQEEDTMEKEVLEVEHGLDMENHQNGSLIKDINKKIL